MANELATVTAEKRNESIQEVPIAMSAINTDALTQNNQLLVQDYATSVPGFTSAPTPSAGSQNTLTIRGISTGFNEPPTVGVVIDDVPYGGATNTVGVPDLDPADLARIEVLRGPQGTLYGASSMGGLLKFVTVDPSTDALSGRVEAGASDVHNGTQAGFAFRASVNIRITDTLAVRVSGFTRQDPGYIDNVLLNINGANEERVDGGRVAALWRPSDIFSVKVSAMYQDTQGYGANYVQVAPGLSDLQQEVIRGAGGYNRQIQQYIATVTAKLGEINITSLTGYGLTRTDDVFDDTLNINMPSGCGGPCGSTVVDAFESYNFSQELRLAGSIGSSFDWLLGAFVARNHGDNGQAVNYTNPTTGAIGGTLIAFGGPSTYVEYAEFADLTYHITDRIDVQIGGRQSEIHQFSGPGFTNYPTSGSYNVNPAYDEDNEHSFTYLATPRFKISPDLMVYARFASGFRPGQSGYVGPDTNCVVYHFPCGYNPDKTSDYEVGLKGDTLEHLLTFDAAVYYIKWADLEVNLNNVPSQTTYTENAGDAKSEGVELSAEAHPLTGMRVSAWTAWNEAILTRVPDPADNPGSAPGDNLPYGARFSANVSADQEFPLATNTKAFLGGTVAYIGERWGTFSGSDARTVFPAYAKTDVHVGAKQGAWTLNLDVNNVMDRRAFIGGGLGTYPRPVPTFSEKNQLVACLS